MLFSIVYINLFFYLFQVVLHLRIFNSILSLEEEASFESGADGGGDAVVDHVGHGFLHARAQLRGDRHRRVPYARAGARRAHRNPTSRELPRRTGKEYVNARIEAKI